MPTITETPPTIKGRGMLVVVQDHDDEPNSPLSTRSGRRPSTDRRSAEEFLELEDEDSMYESTTAGSERVSTADSGEPDDDEDDPHVSTRNGKKRVAAVEDFPLPPTTPPIHPGGEAFTAAQMQALVAQRTQTESTLGDTQSQISGISGHFTSESRAPLLDPRSASSPGEQPPISPFLQSITQKDPPQAKFRALPLLASDLPHTQVHVSYSSIRANDRGKEVLSFVISVDPGSNKDGWNIEKLYSDVLTLDSRVRSNLGKNLAKKLAGLPEGRLRKDHAPAKVDQRKVRSIWHLDIISFLPAVHGNVGTMGIRFDTLIRRVDDQCYGRGKQMVNDDAVMRSQSLPPSVKVAEHQECFGPLTTLSRSRSLPSRTSSPFGGINLQICSNFVCPRC